MSRIVIRKDGATTDVPENELINYLRRGWQETGETLPDALPPEQQKLTVEQAAVNEAAMRLVEAQSDLADAEDSVHLATKSRIL